jgi:hypothetical protein
MKKAGTWWRGSVVIAFASRKGDRRFESQPVLKGVGLFRYLLSNDDVLKLNTYLVSFCLPIWGKLAQNIFQTAFTHHTNNLGQLCFLSRSIFITQSVGFKFWTRLIVCFNGLSAFGRDHSFFLSTSNLTAAKSAYIHSFFRNAH